ncbi:LAETG motif-containing sortase-dependent surface protein [Streptomyces sp. NPDC059092]|uniref:LAETG motif-containing sortase-dependent surface protein n=1 Tax=Streptomyces sp. NPDC059092 TaxID=3346725 RepID=UPI0036A94646
MTQFSRSWRRRSAFIAVAATGALGVGLSAAPAFAHTPTWSVTCSEVSLNLTAYGQSDKNTVTVTVDGKDLLPTENFRNNFSKKLDLPAHKSELTVRLVVKAADGDQFSKDETKTAPVCEGEESTPPPAESTPPQEPASPPAPSESAPEATPSEDTPTTEAPAPTGEASTAPATVPSSQPSPAGGDLAETGSSSSTPLIAGAAGVVLVAGAGIMWAARKRRSAQG